MQLVILDRDGVINEDSDTHVKSPAEWHPIPGSLEAIARLKRSLNEMVIGTRAEQAHADAIKALAEQPDPISETEVIRACYGDGSDWLV